LLVLGITDDCNLRCMYCYAGGGDEKTHMSWQVARRAVDLMVERSDSFTVQFTGGEPLLRPDIFEIIEYGQGKGLRMVIAINGTHVGMAKRRKG